MDTTDSTPSIERWKERPQIQAYLPSLRSLPTMPEAHQRILSVLNDPQYAGERVAHLIANDVTLTAQLLKVVNSPLFALRQRISDVEQAVPIIGAMRLRALVSTAWAFHFIDHANVCAGFNPGAEWEHALSVAMETQQVTMMVNCPPELGQAVFTAGLLHDLGKILLAVNTPERYAPVLDEAKRIGKPLWQVELKMLGFHHGEIAACLLANWGIAPGIVEAVGWHHQPESAPDQALSAITIVHVADCNVRGFEPDGKCAELLSLNERNKT